MKINTIKCEALNVNSADGVCIGIARMKQGEVGYIDGRTPEGSGICSNAFGALSNAAFIMMATDCMPGETDGHMDRVCPHGCVTFRLSRAEQSKSVPFNAK